MAWLWRGMNLKYAGYVEEAILSFSECLVIDPSQTICNDYLAEAYLYNGQVARAAELHAASINAGFFATAPSFVSHYVRNGNRSLALMIARNKMQNRDAPVIEWIKAIEDPSSDHSVGLVRLNDWIRDNEFEIELPPQMLFSFQAHEQMLQIGEMQRRMLFHPDAAPFRQTTQFKEIVRDWGYHELWQKRGFPPQCRAIGVDDFQCD